MANTKKFSEWEREKGWLILNATDKELASSLTEDEFIARVIKDQSQLHGVNWSDREQFLRDNGYKVTRENMSDSSLSIR